MKQTLDAYTSSIATESSVLPYGVPQPVDEDKAENVRNFSNYLKLHDW